MRKGEIKEIDISQYKGKAGNVIRMKIGKKDFAVHNVQISLKYADGNVIESAMAIKKEHGVFIYKTTQTVDGIIPITVEVVISDHCCNTITKQIVTK